MNDELVVCPTCPACDARPMFTLSHSQAFCGNPDCPCLMWDPRLPGGGAEWTVVDLGESTHD